MSLALLIAIILLIIVLVGLFYSPPAPYGNAGNFVAALAALLLFLLAIGVIHL